MRQYFKHRELRTQREATKNLLPAIASNDGYILTQDGRILMRMALGKEPVKLWRSENNDLGLGVSGVTADEAYAVMSRFAQMNDLEEAALSLGADAFDLRKVLLKAYNESASGGTVSSKTREQMLAIIKDTAAD